MIACIHQPSYWPWLGLLDKIAKSDTFILLDEAQVSKGTYQYRNIFWCNGKAKFVTLPVTFNLGMSFNEMNFSNDLWKDDHLAKFRNYYLKAPYFGEVFEPVSRLYQLNFKKPIDLLIEIMSFSFDILGINVKLLRSSSFGLNGKKGEMVLNLCKQVSARQYLAGRGSYEYMQEYLHLFQQENIEVVWHSFKHPVYTQSSKYPFQEGLGCLDLFFFEGFENSKKIFWENITNDK